MNDEKPTPSAQVSKSAQPQRAKKRIIIPLLLLILAGAVATWYWYNNLRGYVSTEDAAIEADAIEIGSKILGRIVELTGEEGDTLHQAVLIVHLDDADLRAQEAQTQASLQYAEQNVALSRVNLERTQEDYDRAVLQIKDRIITQEQFDHAAKAVDIAKAQLKVSESQIATANAQLNVVQTQLKNTQIFAPATAIVAKKWVLNGDIVQPGQPIFTLYDLQNVWVKANLEETKIASIHVGDDVQLEIDAYPHHPFQGKVILLGAAAASQFSLIPPNNASGNFTKVTQRVPIKISITDLALIQKSTPLLPGMSVTIKIKTEQR
jgi:membrane fusion protein, multidrug efflux system